MKYHLSARIFFILLAVIPVTGCSTQTPGVPSPQVSLPDIYMPTRTPVSPAPDLDITYCSPNGLPQKLDFYPAVAGFPDPTPIIIYIHGGAWMEGDKEIASYLSTILLLRESGFSIAAINYRLAPDYPFPAQITDVFCAIRFLRAKSSDLKINPDRFGLLGDSAGGHLAALAGMANPHPDWTGNEYPGINSGVQAIVDLYGPADLTRSYVNSDLDISSLVFQAKENSDLKLVKASPVSYARVDVPPILIIHGDQDYLVPVEQSIRLYNALQEKGAPARLILVKNAGHGFSHAGEGPMEPDQQEIDSAIVDFFQEYLD